MFTTTKEQEFFILRQRTDSTNMEQYHAECVQEAAYLAPYLHGAKTIVDIGCGMGGVAAKLYDHIPAHFTLIDKEDNSDYTYGFSENARFYNQIALTTEFIRTNAPAMSFTALNSITGLRNKVDAIISIYSCAWHYPIDEYASAMISNIHQGGKLILDIRTIYEPECLTMLLPNFDVLHHENIQPTRGTRYIFKKT